MVASVNPDEDWHDGAVKTPRTAVVTGASSGIGAATARALARDGYAVICAARRTERIIALAEEIGGAAVACDITEAADVASLAEAVGSRLDVLVNNAGGAFGSTPVEQANLTDWQAMYDVNVLGTVRVTQALLPALRTSGTGLIVNVGSTAGRVAYPGGGGYTAAKHAARVLTETLRLELNGEPIRVTEIAPGMVHTEEFSLVRFGGDRARAEAVYADVDSPLVAADVAEAIRWVASLPRHVNVDELVIRPVAQAAQHQLHRGPIFSD
ncbi:SDR family oxidoreductase [Nocardioides limicola]|uniref:SDR family oxidoreductase n=1 Tax=Nocardioides limicola TaxID=2803368 RepID=UPI00193BB64D|nr:SDR family NAD(P)-dependent oxidoreductase [Nocardioides sp. DJM-14]